MSAAAILAAKKYLQGSGPWKLDEIGIGADDYLVRCFAEAMDGERAAIVAYLRECEVLHLARIERGRHIRESRHHAAACRLSADAIERGDHRKEAP